MAKILNPIGAGAFQRELTFEADRRFTVERWQ
jgi:hypothetical protein